MERPRHAAHADPLAPAAPLYDPRSEHDACGVGFVADARGRRSQQLVVHALAALASLTHRGAIAADAKTGDGAGIGLPLVRGFRAKVLEEIGRADIDVARVGIGMVFLPAGAAAAAASVLEDAVRAERVEVLGWRDVPVDSSVLGPEAAATAPVIRQLVVGRPAGMGPTGFERALLVARRCAEAAAGSVRGFAGFHVASLSGRTLVYKGLFVGSELGRFYADLADPAMAVAYATFHQRYSTNTHPAWALAQPFRYLAHNGEVNTLRGNREAMRGRAAGLGGDRLGSRISELAATGRPILDPDGSDSTSLDEALELLVASGRRVDGALLALVPEALELRDAPVPGLAAWQAAMQALVEPWDGPAALVFSDGRRVGCLLDRNGLRPAAFEVRRDGLVICASEAGLLPAVAGDVVRRGRLGPGELLVVDPATRRILEDADAKRDALAAAPSGEPPRLLTSGPEAWTAQEEPPDPASARRRQLLFGLDAEALRLTVTMMATTGREPIWSMGDDTPLAVVARRPRGVAGYLRQAFAQVTNPPIDPERERGVMSLEVPVGPRPGFLDTARGGALRCVRLSQPVLGRSELAALLACGEARPDVSAPWRIARLDATWPATAGEPGLEAALDRLVAEAAAARDRGADLLVVSDRHAGPGRAPIPSLLAVGAINAAFVEEGRRSACGLVVEAGDAFDVHGVAMLLAAGADAVQPWLVLEVVRDLGGGRGREDLAPAAAEANALAAIDHGLRKVLARMGISTLASYRGAQLFEVLGLADDVASRCFPAAPRTVGSTTFARLGGELLARHAAAYLEVPGAVPALPDPGFARFRVSAELHAFAPAVVRATQALAAGHPAGMGPGAALAPAEEQASIDDQLGVYRAAVGRTGPAFLRDMLVPRRRRPVLLAAVEPAAEIVRRFVSSAMSLGALSPEAHRTLAIGMRRLGATSNTGEGGEDPAWYEPDENGELAESAIKQVASARFGVTARYLARAEQLEIKMAQGSKPGEGGQLPGMKATPFIAALRRGQVGMTYISPPPHHDIYSIEDLAQLIADLRAINPTARIGVKLVASAGVGTIAAGVAKAHADYVLIAGHSGGTGASPLSSIKSAGTPWELGLAEAHQVLVRQGLRDRVVLRIDGGLQVGRDVVLAALLGAEEYGFGTTALIALGCDMARQCHLDTCPTGIATQRADLRAKFTGTPGQVVAFFLAIAEDVRRELALLGLTRLGDAVGRIDLLRVAAGSALALDRVVGAPTWRAPADRRDSPPKVRGRIAEPPVSSALEERLVATLSSNLDALAAIGPSAGAVGGEASVPADPAGSARQRARPTTVLTASVTTVERTLGARISGELERARDRAGRREQATLATGAPLTADALEAVDAIELRLAGSAGQSLGAFLAAGVRVVVTGVANDFVGKGLSGGTVVIRPPATAGYRAENEAIAGNTCLYGATGGRLHLVGRAGMRFAVRNSGAAAVVEGIGTHGCEYMTGGVVVVLGPTGRNFGAGMTGGRAWLRDPGRAVPDRVNTASVTAMPLPALAGARPNAARLEAELTALLGAHAAEGSALAAALLADWRRARGSFWLVEPIPVAAAPAPAAPAALPVPDLVRLRPGYSPAASRR